MASNVGGDVVIRVATAADAGAVRALRTALFAETDFMLWEPAEFRDSAADEARQIERLNAAPNSRFVVAMQGDEAVGFCVAAGGTVNRTRHSATLALGVRRSHWGRGIGGALLADMVGWSRSAAITRLELTVHTSNLRAIGLYLHGGFQVEGLRRKSLVVDGREVDEYLMSKVSEG